MQVRNTLLLPAPLGAESAVRQAVGPVERVLPGHFPAGAAGTAMFRKTAPAAYIRAATPLYGGFSPHVPWMTCESAKGIHVDVWA